MSDLKIKDMQEIHSLPKWFGYFMFIMAVFLIFPAFGNMLESQSLELWDQKIKSMGVLYTVGSLFWSFCALIFLAVLLGIGIEVIRKRDKSMPD